MSRPNLESTLESNQPLESNQTELDLLPDTPMMLQFKEFKRRYPNDILFFRLGDFYEMFGNDAVIVSKELGLTLTGRGKDEHRVPMCGVPHHAAQSYLAKLVDRGYRVVICDQVEEASASKLTKRDITRIISPGTVMSEDNLDAKSSQYLAAIFVNNLQEWGLAYTDASTGELMVLAGESKEACLCELNRILPKEILIPVAQRAWMDGLVRYEFYEPVLEKIAAIEIARQMKVQDLSIFSLERHDLVLPVIWSLLEYLKQTQKTQLSQICSITPIRRHDYMILDAHTIKDLELLTPIDRHFKKGSLRDVLDHCVTAMGSRRLYQLIQRPFLQQADIEPRLDAIESLKNSNLRYQMAEGLKQVSDIYRLLGRIVSQQHHPKDLLALKESIDHVRRLIPFVQSFSDQCLTQIADALAQSLADHTPLSQICQEIGRAIVDDAPNHIKDAGFIKDGYSEELDRLKATFSDVKNWIQALEQMERDRTGIKSLKVGFNKVFGYYIEISNTYKGEVPEQYIRKQTLSNAERYVTQELKEKEELLLSGEQKQLFLEQTCYDRLIEKLNPLVLAFQAVAFQVSELDLFQGLADVAQKNRYLRPHFRPISEKILKIDKGRHPVLEQEFMGNFVSNSIAMSADSCGFMLLTGPNMAGKSTLMRQVAIQVIMAQLGSFVPADACELSIVDRVFTRIGASDHLLKGQSTFMVEMIETATILHNATPQSLIILDEIGRGTSTYDGVSIAVAVAHYILRSIGARTLFATHYHELSELTDSYENCAKFRMGVQESNQKLYFTYQLEQGAAHKSYGVQVAHMAGLPNSVIEHAMGVLEQLEKKKTCSDLRNTLQLNQLSLF